MSYLSDAMNLIAEQYHVLIDPENMLMSNLMRLTVAALNQRDRRNKKH